MIIFSPSRTIKYEVQRIDSVIWLISMAGSQTSNLYASNILRLGMLLHAAEIMRDTYAWRATHSLDGPTALIQYA